MVIDTSALAAIVWKEPEANAFVEAIGTAPVRLLSSVTALESAIVVQGRYGGMASGDLELLLFNLRIEIVPFDVRQYEAAARAWQKYGKGNHPARLNPWGLLRLCAGEGHGGADSV